MAKIREYVKPINLALRRKGVRYAIAVLAAILLLEVALKRTSWVSVIQSSMSLTEERPKGVTDTFPPLIKMSVGFLPKTRSIPFR